MSSVLSNKRNKFNAAFKLKCVLFAESTNNCAAGREYNVSEKLVRDWRKMKAKLSNMPKKKYADRRGTVGNFLMETPLVEWISQKRQSGLIVTRLQIRLKAKELTSESGLAGFKASAGWCTRFMRRHGLVLRNRTKLAQRLPKDVTEKVVQFQKYVIDIRKQEQHDMSQIANMDETPMTFDMIGSRTVDVKGAKTVEIKSTGLFFCS